MRQYHAHGRDRETDISMRVGKVSNIIGTRELEIQEEYGRSSKMLLGCWCCSLQLFTMRSLMIVMVTTLL